MFVLGAGGQTTETPTASKKLWPPHTASLNYNILQVYSLQKRNLTEKQ